MAVTGKRASRSVFIGPVRLQGYTAKCLTVRVLALRAPWIRRCFNNWRVEAHFSFWGENVDLGCDSGPHFYRLEKEKVDEIPSS